MTEDELDAKVAKLFDGVIVEVKSVNGKPMISDQTTLEQMEREQEARRMEEACGMFLTAERDFQKIDAHPAKASDPQVNLVWWDRLQTVYEREKVVQRLFVRPQPSLEQNTLYAKFREMLVKGSRLKPNA